MRDAAGVRAEPGAVAVRNGRVLAAGAPAEVRAIAENAAEDGPTVIELPGSLLLPGLVNAHAHLDLTELGPRPFERDFIGWVKGIIADRPKDAGAIRRAVEAGVRQSRAAGVLTVGDISPDPVAIRAVRGSGLRGVAFAELFGIGLSPPEAREAIAAVRGAIDAETPPASDAEAESTAIPGNTASAFVPGFSAHAPYSAGPALYQELSRLNAGSNATPICTHLAETEAELQFVAEGTGPFRDLLAEMGKWDARYAAGPYGQGEHPADWLARIMAETGWTDDDGAGRPEDPAQRPKPGPSGPGSSRNDPPTQGPHWLCAHCNYVEDRHIDTLARLNASVAYCPRASDYFGHRDHRYRDMLDAGVNVCLGTDSILCHGTLSILDEMRHLHRRDGTPPDLLLDMATRRGMIALGLDPKNATLSPNAAPGLIALALPHEPRPTDKSDPLAAILAADDPPAVRVLEEAG